MQKKLIALAVAGLVTGSAFAQVAPNNVTLYGIVDVGYQYNSKAQAPGVANYGEIMSGGHDGSRFGFNGTEDLGNGLSVGFTTEFGFKTDTPSATDVTVAKNKLFLSGGFGTVSGGSFGNALDDINGYSESGGMAWGNGVGDMIGLGGDHFNAVKYNSPNMNGFDAMVAYSTSNFKQDSAVKNDLPGYSARVSYAPGPLKVGLAVQRYKSEVAGSSATSEWMLSAGYDFGVVKVGAGYDRMKGGSGKLADGDVRKAYRMTVGAPIGASNAVALSYTRIKLNYEAGGSDSANGIGLSFNHTMSKRTNVYASYGQTSGDDAVNSIGGYDRAFKVGVRHLF